MKKKYNLIIATLVGVAMGGLFGAGSIKRIYKKQIAKEQQMSDKHLELFKMMNQWVRVKQEGKNLSSYFEKNNYKTIAIYGMSYAGETLIEELRGTNIEVLYAIDQQANRIFADIDIITPVDELRKVDVVVITAITFFDEIKDELSKIVDYDIISLEDILYEV